MENLGITEIKDSGNVHFAPGVVKSIRIEKTHEIDFYNGLDRNIYCVELNDGTTLRYRKQKETNQAVVESSNETIYFKGFDGIEVFETKNNDKYEFQGCRGYVNVYDNNNSQDFDTVTTKNRIFNNGVVQDSSMQIISDKNAKVKGTENDSIWNVWEQRQQERAASKK